MNITFTPPKRFVQSVFLHCSASDNPSHDDIKVIREWHVMGNKWKDVGYHFFIKKDGTVQKGRSLEEIPAAQLHFNVGSIAICVGGLKNFSKEQMKSLKELCTAIRDAYKISNPSRQIRFRGHREVDPGRECPVFDYIKVLNLDVKGFMKS